MQPSLHSGQAFTSRRLSAPDISDVGKPKTISIKLMWLISKTTFSWSINMSTKNIQLKQVWPNLSCERTTLVSLSSADVCSNADMSVCVNKNPLTWTNENVLPVTAVQHHEHAAAAGDGAPPDPGLGSGLGLGLCQVGRTQPECTEPMLWAPRWWNYRHLAYLQKCEEDKKMLNCKPRNN